MSELNSTKRTDIYTIDPRNVVIVENFNVRKEFALDELKEQIKLQGVLNPITVVPFKDEDGNEKYRLVDGERRKYLATYDERAKQIPKECDPQEVYFYEWNNHETMYSWDGDYEAIKIILEYFGMEAAMSITRIDACDLNKLIERDHPYIFRPQSEPTV